LVGVVAIAGDSQEREALIREAIAVVVFTAAEFLLRVTAVWFAALGRFIERRAVAAYFVSAEAAVPGAGEPIFASFAFTIPAGGGAIDRAAVGASFFGFTHAIAANLPLAICGTRRGALSWIAGLISAGVPTVVWAGGGVLIALVAQADPVTAAAAAIDGADPRAFSGRTQAVSAGLTVVGAIL